MHNIDLNQYHHAVTDFIAQGCPWLSAVHVYPEINGPFKTPCAFFAVKSWDLAPDTPADSQLKINLSCVLLVAVNKTANDYAKYIRQAAMGMTVFLQRSRLGVPSEPVQVLGAEPADFIPDLEAYEVWGIDFLHSIYVGESLYKDENGAVPQRIFTSFAPLIGQNNEPFYSEIIANE